MGKVIPRPPKGGTGEVYRSKLTKDSVVAETGAVKNDLGKLRYDLIPAHPMKELAKVLTFGANKYADRNWELGFPWSRAYAALQRHLNQWYAGEDIDPETGLSHLSHALCNLTFLSEFERTHKELDDRVK